MRKMSYMLKLTEGYTITSGAWYDYRNCENAPDTNIRMMVEWSEETNGDVMDFFRVEDSAPSEFERLLPQIIRGEETPWRLDIVHVYSHLILICFVNDALAAEKESLWGQHKDEGAQAICSAVEMEIQLYEGRERYPDMIMRFEVPLPDGSGVSTTLVSTNGRNSVEVTELNTDRHRVLEFLKIVKDEDNQHEIYSDLVEVTEYSW